MISEFTCSVFKRTIGNARDSNSITRKGPYVGRPRLRFPKWQSKQRNVGVLPALKASKQREGFMGKAYDVVTPEDSRSLYNGWATSYDKDLVENYGYVGPSEVLSVLLHHLDENKAEPLPSFSSSSSSSATRVLDAGCGTGMLGELLRGSEVLAEPAGEVLRGAVLDGVDISEEMLSQCQTKGVYDTLFAADLTDKPVPGLESDAYEMVVSAGTFTHGHVGPQGIYELLRATKEGGLLVFSVNIGVWEKDGYQAVLDTMEKSGTCQVLEVRHMEYLTELGIQCKVVVLQK